MFFTVIGTNVFGLGTLSRQPNGIFYTSRFNIAVMDLPVTDPCILDSQCAPVGQSCQAAKPGIRFLDKAAQGFWRYPETRLAC